MAKEQIQHIDISDVPALIRLAEEVKHTRRPAVLYRGDEELAVLVPSARQQRTQLPIMADPEDIWANYDPERVQEALRRSAGALRGLDRDAFLADLAEQRQQNSSGRPDDA